MASPGQDVGIEVYTHFVGDGSDIRISVHNRSGRRLDRFGGKVYRNRYGTTYTVSDRAEDGIYFEAELRRHGLSKRSEEMTIIPPIEITNLRWSQEEAQRGDVLQLSADVRGAHDGTEAVIEIYEHDEDGAHDFIARLNALVEDSMVEVQWGFEYYEDIDDIPTEEESESGYNPPEYFFKVIIYGQEAESELLEFKDWVEFNFEVYEDNYVPGVQATFTYPDGRQETREIPEDGTIRFDNVPPGRYRLEVEEYKVVIEGES